MINDTYNYGFNSHKPRVLVFSHLYLVFFFSSHRFTWRKYCVISASTMWRERTRTPGSSNQSTDTTKPRKRLMNSHNVLLVFIDTSPRSSGPVLSWFPSIRFQDDEAVWGGSMCRGLDVTLAFLVEMQPDKWVTWSTFIDRETCSCGFFYTSDVVCINPFRHQLSMGQPLSGVILDCFT